MRANERADEGMAQYSARRCPDISTTQRALTANAFLLGVSDEEVCFSVDLTADITMNIRKLKSGTIRPYGTSPKLLKTVVRVGWRVETALLDERI